jgi:MFS family permease
VATGSEPAFAWMRLGISVLLSTLGGISLWSVVVVLPAVQAEFAVDRAAASLPYTLTMVGFAVGGVLMGRVADRFGVMVPALIGAVALSIGYVAAGYATSLWQFALAHGLLIALFGGAATFGPIVADTSLWFTRHRGIAVAIAASGNYLAGTVWPPFVQHFVQTVGWRQTHIGIGVLCAITMIPLALALRRMPPTQQLEYLPAREGGMRFGMVIMATLFGMAFGGWISGMIFDATGSYSAAFANGALWNLLNLCIAVALLTRSARRMAPA